MTDSLHFLNSAVQKTYKIFLYPLERELKLSNNFRVIQELKKKKNPNHDINSFLSNDDTRSI